LLDLVPHCASPLTDRRHSPFQITGATSKVPKEVGSGSNGLQPPTVWRFAATSCTSPLFSKVSEHTPIISHSDRRRAPSCFRAVLLPSKTRPKTQEKRTPRQDQDLRSSLRDTHFRFRYSVIRTLPCNFGFPDCLHYHTTKYSTNSVYLATAGANTIFGCFHGRSLRFSPLIR